MSDSSHMFNKMINLLHKEEITNLLDEEKRSSLEKAILLLSSKIEMEEISRCIQMSVIVSVLSDELDIHVISKVTGCSVEKIKEFKTIKELLFDDEQKNITKT